MSFYLIKTFQAPALSAASHQLLPDRLRRRRRRRFVFVRFSSFFEFKMYPLTLKIFSSTYNVHRMMYPFTFHCLEIDFSRIFSIESVAMATIDTWETIFQARVSQEHQSASFFSLEIVFSSMFSKHSVAMTTIDTWETLISNYESIREPSIYRNKDDYDRQGLRAGPSCTPTLKIANKIK